MPSDERRHAEMIKMAKEQRDEEMRRAADMLAGAGFYDDPANNLDLAAMKAQQAKDAELAALRKRVEELEAILAPMAEDYARSAHANCPYCTWSVPEGHAPNCLFGPYVDAHEAAAAGGGD
jgi:hypothetical protein